MPLYLCNNQKCNHEWEGSSQDTKCDWCGEDSTIIQEQTPLEKALKDIEFMKNFLNQLKKDRGY